MKKHQIGIVCCSSIINQVRNSLEHNENYRVYPLVPSCMFTISSELIKHVFDQACLDNDNVLLVYGNCHPELQSILSQYSQRIIKLNGDNCWEMLLGKETAQEYESQGYWLLKNALCTTWRNEVFLSYGAESKYGNLIQNCNTKKVLGCRFEKGKPREKDVAFFAQKFGIPYEIIDCDLANFNKLVNTGINQAKSRAITQKNTTCKRSYLRQKTPFITTEARFRINTLSNELVFISPKISQLLGYSAIEFAKYYFSYTEGKYYRSIEVFNQISNERFDYFSKCLSRGIQLPINLEYPVFHKNRSLIWIRESFSPRYNNDGTINPNFVGKLENITKLKQTEEELRKSYAKENQLRIALEKEIQRRSEFTHALVHELKTPLTPILLASDALTNAGKSENNWKPLVNNISQGAQQLNKRISELVDLARGETGNLDIKIKPFNLNDAVIEIVDFFNPKAQYFNHSILLQLTDKLPKATGDRERIKQVISNLLDNAIKYSGNGSQIIISTKDSGKELTFIIEDNGNGISKSKLTDIFDPYNRNSKNRLGGLGLGLALAKSIIERHNGRIWAENNKGTGCSFFFTIPSAKASGKSTLYETINC